VTSILELVLWMSSINKHCAFRTRPGLFNVACSQLPSIPLLRKGTCLSLLTLRLMLKTHAEYTHSHSHTHTHAHILTHTHTNTHTTLSFLFAAHVPQEPANRIRKEFLKECKQLGPGQRVLIIGNSREPFLATRKVCVLGCNCDYNFLCTSFIAWAAHFGHLQQ